MNVNSTGTISAINKMLGSKQKIMYDNFLFNLYTIYMHKSKDIDTHKNFSQVLCKMYSTANKKPKRNQIKKKPNKKTPKNKTVKKNQKRNPNNTSTDIKKQNKKPR